jgi:hypothetical protein
MPCHPESRAAIGFLANTFQVNRTVLVTKIIELSVNESDPDRMWAEALSYCRSGSARQRDESRRAKMPSPSMIRREIGTSSCGPFFRGFAWPCRVTAGGPKL